MRRFLRCLSIVVLTGALVWGIGGLLDQVRDDQRGDQQPDLSAYAGAICSGLAGPADSYRAMVRVPNSKRSAPNVGLKNWYVTYLDTMRSSTSAALTTLRGSTVGDDRQLSYVHGQLVDFFSHAEEFSTSSLRQMRAMNIKDPHFDAKIDQLTGGSIAPEHFDKLLTKVRANSTLDRAMTASASCKPATNDLHLVLQGRMLDLFAGTRTI